MSLAQIQHGGAVVVGFATAATAAAPFGPAPAKPRSLLSELLYEAQQYEMMDSDSDGFSSDDEQDYDMQTTGSDATELCELCQMSASCDTTPGSSPIAIPSATYIKDAELRRQLYQLMHQRQLYKQHEEQQAAEQRRKEGMQGARCNGRCQNAAGGGHALASCQRRC